MLAFASNAMDGMAIIRLRAPIDPDDSAEDDDGFLLAQEKAASFAGVPSQPMRPKESPHRRRQLADPPGISLGTGRVNSYQSDTGSNDDFQVNYHHSPQATKSRSRFMDRDRNVVPEKSEPPPSASARSLEPVSYKLRHEGSYAEDPRSTVSAPGRSVQFDSVEVHEHPYTLDAGGGIMNPDTGVISPPLTLSWTAQSVSLTSIEEFEAIRGPQRRSKDAMFKSEEEKVRILRNAGFASEELTVVAAPVEEPLVEDSETSGAAAEELFQDYQASFIKEEKTPPRGGLRGLRRLFSRERRNYTV